MIIKLCNFYLAINLHVINILFISNVTEIHRKRSNQCYVYTCVCIERNIICISN